MARINAPFTGLVVEGVMSLPGQPRRSERLLVEMDAHCRTQSGLRDRGRISNISAEGCCVTTNALFVKEGLRVLVKPEGMEGLSGVIRWIEGNSAGILFDTPLYQPIVEHLAARYGVEPVPVSITRY